MAMKMAYKSQINGGDPNYLLTGMILTTLTGMIQIQMAVSSWRKQMEGAVASTYQLGWSRVCWHKIETFLFFEAF